MILCVVPYRYTMQHEHGSGMADAFITYVYVYSIYYSYNRGY